MKKTILIIIIALFSNYTSYSQGCSDAGICSIGNSFQDSKTEFKNGIEIGNIFGTGEADITYFSSYLTYTRTINDQLSFSSKVTYSIANGSFGQRGAFGDGYLIGNYNWKTKTTRKWSSLIAFKIPFTSSNLKINEFSLPLDYQSSLGTFDLIVGLNLNYKKWDFNTAIQVPIFNNNKNSYFKEFSNTDDFSSTNLFERKPDALFRTTYTIQLNNKKLSFKPNLLFIYHLGEDRFENAFGKTETIQNSDGLTINGNLITSYAINSKKSIELSIASPFLVREARPDGLTRGFTAGLIYKVVF
jgi:hypothetical protein